MKMVRNFEKGTLFLFKDRNVLYLRIELIFDAGDLESLKNDYHILTYEDE